MDSGRGQVFGLDLTEQWAASFKIVKQEKVWLKEHTFNHWLTDKLYVYLYLTVILIRVMKSTKMFSPQDFIG
jgi:hypothetical protein